MTRVLFAALFAPVVACSSGVAVEDAGGLDAAVLDGALADASVAMDGDSVDAETAEAGSSDAASPDAATSDAGPDAAVALPITAPNETWTWLPIEGMRCGNGSQNGVVVNLTDRSDDLYIVYEGGGGCWDWDTCFEGSVASRIWEDLDPDAMIETAIAYGGRESATNSYFMRSDDANPFRDASFVFVPYCTGDLHSGSGTTTYTRGGESRTVHYVGADNQEILVARLRATFPEAEHVWVTGFSAGGFGATMNWWRYLEAFEGSEVHALNDCGTPADSNPTRWNAWKTSMHLQFPPGCDDCTEGFSRLFPHYARTVGAPHRFGYMGYRGDAIVAFYFGFLAAEDIRNVVAVALAAAEVARHTDAAAAALAGGGLQHAYRLDGIQHVMQGQPSFETTMRTVSAPRTYARDWVRQWALGEAGWRSVGP